MSGEEITSSNDDASLAKANRKQLLAASGTNIQAATKQGAGQLAFSTATNSGLRGECYYNTDFTNSMWFPHISCLLHRTNWGHFQPVSSTFADNTEGLWNATTSTGTVALQSLDTSNGRSIRFTTGGSAGDQGGFRENNLTTIRKFSPILRVKFQQNETTSLRMFIGLVGTTSLLGNTDDPLNTISGIGIAKSTASANWRIFHNDSAGATVSDDTGIAVDTSPHEFDIYADDTNTRFFWSIDLGTTGFVTTDIPGQTASLAFQATYTTTTASARSFQLFQSFEAFTPM